MHTVIDAKKISGPNHLDDKKGSETADNCAMKSPKQIKKTIRKRGDL